MYAANCASLIKSYCNANLRQQITFLLTEKMGRIWIRNFLKSRIRIRFRKKLFRIHNTDVLYFVLPSTSTLSSMTLTFWTFNTKLLNCRNNIQVLISAEAFLQILSKKGSKYLVKTMHFRKYLKGQGHEIRFKITL